jgi:hypothetical protein
MADSAEAKIRKGKEPMLRNTLTSAEEAPEVRAQAVKHKLSELDMAKNKIKDVVDNITAKGGGMMSRLWKKGKNR